MQKLSFYISTLKKILANKSYAINRNDLDNNFLWAFEALAEEPAVNVRFAKLDPNAVIPSYAKPGDAGLDLTAVAFQNKTEDGIEFIEYDLGLSIEIPEGYVGFMFPRSSISKTDLSLANAVGVIDSGYRGKLTARFRKTTNKPLTYKVGDRVAQLIVLPYPTVTISEVKYNDLTKTSRGTGGFGSTGA